MSSGSRAHGVYDRTESFRNFNFSQKQMADIALTFRATPTTTLRAEYETGRIRDNVGTNQQATDQHANWVNGGRRLITTPLAANETGPAPLMAKPDDARLLSIPGGREGHPRRAVACL